MEKIEVGRKIVTKNLFWRFLERSGAQIVSFVVSIILARLLDPVVYGTVALVTIFTTILQVFVDSGFGTALIQKKDADDLDFSTVFFFNMGMCSLLYIAMFFLAPLIAKFYGNNELIPLIRVISVVILISGIKNVQISYVSKHLIFKKFFWATFVGTVISAAVGIYMAYRGYGVWALVAQSLINQGIDAIMLWIMVKWRPKFIFSFARLKGLFKYGWKLLASELLNTGYIELRSLVIGKKYSSEDLAYYNKGCSLPKIIVQNINSSIDSVLLPSLSIVQDKKERIKAMTRRAMTTSSFIMLPAMFGLVAIAKPLVLVLLGEKWLPCTIFMQLACITYAFYPLQTANLNAIKAMGRSDYFFRLEIIKKSIGLALLFSFMWISVEAIAWSALISLVVGLIVNSWPNKRLMNYSLIEQLKDIFPTIVLSAFMGAVVYIIGIIGTDTIRTLIMQILFGVVIYIAGASFFKLEPYNYIKKIISDFLSKKE